MKKNNSLMLIDYQEMLLKSGKVYGLIMIVCESYVLKEEGRRDAVWEHGMIF